MQLNRKSTASLWTLTCLTCCGVVYKMSHLNAPPSEVAEVIASKARSEIPRKNKVSGAQSTRWLPLLELAIHKEERLEIARQIRGELPPEEIEFLFDCMTRVPSPGDENNWWELVNEIMEQMRKNGVGSSEYSERLCSIIRDEEQSNVIRDYAVQHLTQWLAPISGSGINTYEGHENRQDFALETIVQAISDPLNQSSSIPGTGLMALTDISSRLPNEVALRVWAEVDRYLEGAITGTSSVPRHTRITSIQVAAIQNRRQHQDTIRKFVSDPSCEADIRLASISALGIYGDLVDRSLLEEIARTEGQFQYAAKSAIEKLDRNIIKNSNPHEVQ